MPKEMLPIVDKPTIQYIIEEAIASGIEEAPSNVHITRFQNHKFSFIKPPIHSKETTSSLISTAPKGGTYGTWGQVPCPTI